MSTWSYCEHCGGGNDYPTTPRDDTTCSHCGEHKHPTLTAEDWIELLLDRIEKLEVSDEH